MGIQVTTFTELLDTVKGARTTLESAIEELSSYVSDETDIDEDEDVPGHLDVDTWDEVIGEIEDLKVEYESVDWGIFEEPDETASKAN